MLYLWVVGSHGHNVIGHILGEAYVIDQSYLEAIWQLWVTTCLTLITPAVEE